MRRPGFGGGRGGAGRQRGKSRSRLSLNPRVEPRRGARGLLVHKAVPCEARVEWRPFGRPCAAPSSRRAGDHSEPSSVARTTRTPMTMPRRSGRSPAVVLFGALVIGLILVLAILAF